MSRFIAQLLIVSLLTMNIAWAVDKCAFTSPGAPGDVSVLTDAKPPADPANAGLSCDDWCHAWVNPVALPSVIVADGCACTFIIGISCISSYSSLGIPPPFHPPIV